MEHVEVKATELFNTEVIANNPPVFEHPFHAAQWMCELSARKAVSANVCPHGRKINRCVGTSFLNIPLRRKEWGKNDGNEMIQNPLFIPPPQHTRDAIHYPSSLLTLHNVQMQRVWDRSVAPALCAWPPKAQVQGMQRDLLRTRPE